MPISTTSTKDKIVNVSIDLFSKNGYAETSIRDIAKNAGIKTSSIYYHFESKEDILSNILDKYMEIVTHDKHFKKWSAEKNSIISEEFEISVEKILSYMFFYFDVQDADKILKMLKIICSEAVRNNTVRDCMHQIIDSGYRYIKLVLDTLTEAGKITKCDTAKLSATLYSIAFAFMHYESINMHSVGEENSGTDMFAPLEYVLKMALNTNQD